MNFEQRLGDAGYRVLRAGADHDYEELRPLLEHAVAWIAGTGPITPRLIAAAPELRVISRYGVGTDAIAKDAARARGIVITNAPGSNSDAVADHTVALMLAGLRRVVVGDRQVRLGDWSPQRSRELGSLTVGIVGFGRIGQGVARRLSGFGSSIIAFDPFLPTDVFTQFGAQSAEFDLIADRCDVISLHAPGGTVIVDQDWLARLTRPALLVNTARADLIVEPDVAAALRSGRLSGYAADTLTYENIAAGGPLLASDLQDQVTITPHWAAQTVEAIDRMGEMAVDSALAVLEGRPVEFSVH